MKQLNFTVALLLGFGMIQYGCDSGKPDDESLEYVASEKKPEMAAFPEMGSYNGDTINMHGKFVLFYGPDAEKIKSDTTSGNSVSIFQTVSMKVIDSLNQKSDVTALYTTVNCIRIYSKTTGKPMVILRNSFDEPVGFILTDGLQPPLIKKGAVPESECHEIINRFFVQPS